MSSPRIDVDEVNGVTRIAVVWADRSGGDGDIVLANRSGRVLQPQMTGPAGTKNITISADGIVNAAVAGSAEPVEIGQLHHAKAGHAAVQPLGHVLGVIAPVGVVVGEHDYMPPLERFVR